MRRQVWAVLVAAGAYGGSTAGQLPPLALIPPPPAARPVAPPPRPVSPPSEVARPEVPEKTGPAVDSSPDGEIGVLRVGNQAPQVVRVIRVAHHSGKDSLADVFEPSTGRRFTTPARYLTLGQTPPRPPAQETVEPPLAKRAGTAVLTPRPGPLPPAPAPAVARHDQSPIRIPEIVGRPTYTADGGRVGGFGPKAPAMLPPMAVAAPAAVPQAVSVPPATLPTPAARPLKPVGLAAQTAPPGPEFPAPSQVRRIIPVTPRTPARTPDRVAKAAVPTPQRVVHATGPAPAPVPPVRVADPQSVSVVPAAARIPDPVPIQFARLAPPAPGQMEDELRPFIRDMSEALRPSVRERAATALADGRYGWRPEVKGYLVAAAQTDPSPTVQAHCIRLLSRLGYHERTYLQFLLECCASDSRQVASAAGDALHRLGIRY